MFVVPAEPLKEQVGDMRSAVLKVACSVVTQLAGHLGDAFAPLAEHLIPVILTNTCKSIQVAQLRSLFNPLFKTSATHILTCGH